MDLRGATAVVTGASSGIGAATAEALAAAGADVIALARRADRLAQTVERCPGGRLLALDVADPKVPQRVLDAAGGRVDVLVNNAAMALHRPAHDCTAEEVARLFDVNFHAVVRLTLVVLPGMRARGRGAVVNVTSVSGHLPNPREAAYGASKAALSRWSHGLALDLAGTGVQVCEVSPGPIDTEMWDAVGRATYPGRLHPPEAVAQAVVTAVRTGRVHATAPRRYGVPAALYPLLGPPMRWGLRRYGQRRDRATR